jgi:hypothetical protein
MYRENIGNPPAQAPGDENYDEFYVIHKLREAGLWHSAENVPCQPLNEQLDTIDVTVYPHGTVKGNPGKPYGY